MYRRKKIVNFHEGVTRKLLSDAAKNNGAQVFSKVRIADVLEISDLKKDPSDLQKDLSGYALMAHFDFVVADKDTRALFAVEFDGPHHERNERAKLNDKKKNAICERTGLPLARVRDEHLFQKARGVNYLTWLTELFFSFQALIEAQKQGILPLDEPLDPMMFASNPNIAGYFPLFISVESRARLEQLHKLGVLGAPTPFHFCGRDPSEHAACIMIMPTSTQTYLVTSASIYLQGLGVTPSEAAEEIATVNLARMAEEYRVTKEGSVSSQDLRVRLVEFLRHHRLSNFGGLVSMDLGFSVSYKAKGGAMCWFVGPLDGEAPVEIKAFQ